MFKPGDRVQMYRNNPEVTYISRRFEKLTGTVQENGSYKGDWIIVKDDEFSFDWYIPATYLKRI